MQVLPIDVTSLVAIIMGTSIVLIPVAGLTARYALKPVVDAIGRFVQGKGAEETVQIMERRMALLEQQLDVLQHTVDRIEEVTSFDAQLKAASAAPKLPSGEDSTSG